jgi:energy-coupling factor transport system permease protein
MSNTIEYQEKNTFIHSLNPITKLLWTFTIIIISFVFNDYRMILLLLLLNIIVSAFARVIDVIVPFIYKLLIFALFLVLLQIFFITDGNIIFSLIPSKGLLNITDIGLKTNLIMVTRMLAMVSTIPIFITVTSITDIVVVMVEKLKVPVKYTFMFTTAVRFIPLFISQMDQILQAQKSRGIETETKNPVKKLKLILPIAVPLLLSSIRKSEMMAISMETRGFGEGERTHYKEISIKRKDIVCIIVMLLIILISIYLRIMNRS